MAHRNFRIYEWRQPVSELRLISHSKKQVLKENAFLDGKRIVKRRFKKLGKNLAKKKYTCSYVAVCSLLPLRMSILCRKVPYLKYSRLGPKRQTHRHYVRGIGYSKSVSGDPIRQLVTISRRNTNNNNNDNDNNNQCRRKRERSVPISTFLINHGA